MDVRAWLGMVASWRGVMMPSALLGVLPLWRVTRQFLCAMRATWDDALVRCLLVLFLGVIRNLLFLR